MYQNKFKNKIKLKYYIKLNLPYWQIIILIDNEWDDQIWCWKTCNKPVRTITLPGVNLEYLKLFVDYFLFQNGDN